MRERLKAGLTAGDRIFKPANAAAILGGVIGLVIVAYAVWPKAASEPSRPALAEVAAEDVVACGVALVEAERRGIGPADTRTTVPWVVRRTGQPGQIACAVTSSRGQGMVTATRTCEGAGAACTRLDQLQIDGRELVAR